MPLSRYVSGKGSTDAQAKLEAEAAAAAGAQVEPAVAPEPETKPEAVAEKVEDAAAAVDFDKIAQRVVSSRERARLTIGARLEEAPPRVQAGQEGRVVAPDQEDSLPQVSRRLRSST